MLRLYFPKDVLLPVDSAVLGLRLEHGSNSRPVQQTELLKLMPGVFHKGWGRLERGREMRRKRGEEKKDEGVGV